VPRYPQVGYGYRVTCEHIVGIFNYRLMLLILGNWWAVRAAVAEVGECVGKVRLGC